MIWRVSSALFLALYVVVACGVGVVHDHSHGHGEKDCAACAWLRHAVSDAPASATHVVVPVSAVALVLPETPLLLAPVLCNTGSRAPPLPSA